MLKVSIDSGKSQTKVSYMVDGEVKNFKLLSNVSQNENEIPTSDEAVAIRYTDSTGANKRYLVGELGKNDFTHLRTKISKINDAHKLLVLTSIAKVLEKCDLKECRTVEISINTPVELFKQANQQTVIKEFYQNNDRPYEIYLNDTLYTFTINKVTPLFEGLGAVLLNKSKFNDDEVISIDLGSLNTCFATFNNCKPIGSLSSNFNIGVENLLTDVEKILVTEDMGNLSETNIQNIIKGVYKYPIETSVQNEINKICEDHVVLILHKLQSSKLNLSLPIIFSGGGAILLERFLKNTFKTAIFCDNALYANSQAGLKLL